jgi:hypothetical protein
VTGTPTPEEIAADKVAATVNAQMAAVAAQMASVAVPEDWDVKTATDIAVAKIEVELASAKKGEKHDYTSTS